jgi:two-component system, OmpR family, sensor histidine kinase BaeS
LLSAAGMLIILAAINPDAWIARHNLDRYEDTGKIDWAYVGDLSSDAVPTIATYPADVRACALPRLERTSDDDWLEWNLGRYRAEQAARGLTVDSSADCISTP